MYELSLDINKVLDMNIGSNCHVYISILLLPEAKRELVQRTKKGSLSISNSMNDISQTVYMFLRDK